MFLNCNSLKSINVSHFNTENVNEILGMFAGCTSLTSIDLSNFNTKNLVNMDNLFEECTSLTSIDLSNFVTTNLPNMSDVFLECNNLSYIDISNFSNSTKLINLFEGVAPNGTLKINKDIRNNIDIPDSWKIIEIDNETKIN